MVNVLSLVNQVTSTSIPVEIASKVDEVTESDVTIGAVMQDGNENLDPDIRAMDLSMTFFAGRSNFDPRPYLNLERHLQKNDYDVVHTHHNFSGSVSRIVGRINNVAVVNTEHNDHLHFSIPQRVANAVTYRIPDANVYNSNSTFKSIDPISRRFSRRNEVIYNGIDVDRIEEGRTRPLPVDLPDGILVTNVGVMTPQKNQRVLLDVAKEFESRRSFGDVHFVIAGSGPLAEDLKERAAALGVEDRVLFTGYLPEREQVYRLLHESDVFIVPSVYEGFCVAAVEAMACGLPLVASDLEVLREVVGPKGIFVDHADAKALANAVAEVIEVEERSEENKLKEKVQQRALSKFSLTNTAERYHELYEELSS